MNIEISMPVIMIVIFSLMAIYITHGTFSNLWYTSYGVRLPYKLVKRKWILLLPWTIAGMGTVSFFSSDWGNPISVMPKVLALCIIVTTIYCLFRWFTSPKALSTPIDFMIKAHWPFALRVDITKRFSVIDPAFKNFLDSKDSFIITNVSMYSLFFAYAEFLYSIGQVLIRYEFIDDPVKGAPVKVESCYLITQEFEDPEVEYMHFVLYMPEDGFVSFSCNNA